MAEEKYAESKATSVSARTQKARLERKRKRMMPNSKIKRLQAARGK